jgi:beta-aspartyl-peptidase (threonine type)
MSLAVIVHGGSGAVPPDAGVRQAACDRAADTACGLLERGGRAIEAVECAVSLLEDEPALNAGTGSDLQADGLIRMDVSVMTADGRAGAVAQVPGLRNPIRLARYILEQDAHVMLSGEEALQLGLRVGLEPAVVATPAKVAYWQQHLDEAGRRLDYATMAAAWQRDHAARLGTVGCVALDCDGRLAAGTSTGGTALCYPGRVGDTAVIGAGTYCTPLAGVSMTGLGERMLVLLSAKRFCDLVGDGLAIDRAARLVLAEIAGLTTGVGGLIALDGRGASIAMHDTPFLVTAERRR